MCCERQESSTSAPEWPDSQGDMVFHLLSNGQGFLMRPKLINNYEYSGEWMQHCHSQERLLEELDFTSMP
jgi:hypothetical protein